MSLSLYSMCCYFFVVVILRFVFFAKLKEALLPYLVKSEMVINLFRQFTHQACSSHKIAKKEVAEGLQFSFAQGFGLTMKMWRCLNLPILMMMDVPCPVGLLVVVGLSRSRFPWMCWRNEICKKNMWPQILTVSSGVFFDIWLSWSTQLSVELCNQLLLNKRRMRIARSIGFFCGKWKNARPAWSAAMVVQGCQLMSVMLFLPCDQVHHPPLDFI